MSKKVIRYNIWETNSSSMHTVTVRRERDINEYYRPPSDGVITIQLDEYGWGGDPCDDFISKLKYAMSMVLHTEYPGYHDYNEDSVIDQNILENLDGYKLLLDAINKHMDCKSIIIKRNNNSYYPYGYIDHQSYENYNSLHDFLDDWSVDAERFLFDDGVVVWIDNDNH